MESKCKSCSKRSHCQLAPRHLKGGITAYCVQYEAKGANNDFIRSLTEQEVMELYGGNQ